MLFATAFFSLLAAIIALKFIFFKQNLHSAANLPISPAPPTLNARPLLIFCEKRFFLLQDNCFFGTI